MRRGTRDATYRVVYYPLPNGGRYVAFAWDDGSLVAISTRDHATSTEARAELSETAEQLNVRLRRFDGEYESVEGTGQIIPRESFEEETNR